MSYFKQNYSLSIKPVVPAERTAVFGKLRVSIITSRLIRVEYSKNKIFTDDATQSVWNRSGPDFETSEFDIRKQGGKIIAETKHVIFSCRAKDGKFKKLYFKDTNRSVDDPHEENLRGTCRTLDGAIGAVKLSEGIISRKGLAVMDDSQSLLLDAQSQVKPRESRGEDKYYFAYGNDYRGCLRDFYSMTGQIPFIPRYALANWWSRYKAYTQKEYLELMERFDKEEIPISVATVDMDWHWVDLKRFDKKDTMPNRKNQIRNSFWGSGWTGYTWDSDLFPDWKDFLRTLQAQGRKVTLNLHPADGVRAFEEPYEEMAKGMGVNPASREAIPFDITDPRFVENYFRTLHHPLEEKGVDFWWIDWQQGKKSNIPGLDPLWALNHYHYLDSMRPLERLSDGNNKPNAKRRPLIMSRYAGPGSHRYPLGFSGDTFINWANLRFQPYFTANAANIGYTWWSHDIGGHMHCVKDDELFMRWVQFAVFNPIMRLHSTSNEFMGKEPWKYRDDVGLRVINDLRLRHRLVPYIYTENRRSHVDGIAICEPMYYRHPKDKAAYRYKNEYYFGSQLLCAPITAPMDKKTNFAKVRLWLPEGRWTDIFNNRIYDGGREITVCRGLESIPVFAAAGAIIPLSLDGKKNDWGNPAEMEIWVWRGNNTYTLYEDDGETMSYQNGEYRETDLTVSEKNGIVQFSVVPKFNPDCRTSSAWLPKKRSYRLSFRDIVKAGKINVTINGVERDCTVIEGDTLALDINNVSSDDKIEISLSGVSTLCNRPTKEALIDVISKFQCNVEVKKKLWTSFIDCPKENIPGNERYHAAIREILELAK